MSEPPTLLLEVAIEPKTKADQEKLAAALTRMIEEDPSFSASIDSESGQMILKGMSDLQLDRKVDILFRTYNVRANVGAPQVAYRETLTRKVEVDYTHRKQTGAAGQFARVKIVFEPQPPGFGYAFENGTVGHPVPDEFIPGVEKGLNASRDNGILAGFPLIDFKATLIDGAYHEVDSNPFTFEIAARAAFRELKERKAVRLLQPIMRLEVTTPDDFLSGVIADINSRLGEVQGTDARTGAVIVTATVPLTNLFGYHQALETLSNGRASAVAAFSHYAQVPLSLMPDDDDPRFPPAIGMRA